MHGRISRIIKAVVLLAILCALALPGGRLRTMKYWERFASSRRMEPPKSAGVWVDGKYVDISKN